jgi:hypothetical protein
MNSDPAKITRQIRRKISVALVLICLAINSTAQTISFYPTGDSISFWGTCTPPGMTWHLISDSSGTDKVVIHRYACELIHGLPTNVIARFDSAWFSIADSLNCNSYQLWLTNLSAYNGGTFNVPSDDVYYLYSGPIILKLLVIRQSIPVDSAIVVGFAYQTGLAVEDRPQTIPGSVQLHQNFPNPFNGQTTVIYQLPTAGHVDVQVIDLLGRRIQVLQSEFQPAGINTLHWDATTLASGTYFIILNAVGKRSVINCQLMK